MRETLCVISASRIGAVAPVTVHRFLDPRCVGARRRETRYPSSMSALKVHVENGRIKVDEATDLPNGTEVCLVPADQLGDLVLVGGDGLG